jgi:hypothetical protein
MVAAFANPSFLLLAIRVMRAANCSKIIATIAAIYLSTSPAMVTPPKKMKLFLADRALTGGSVGHPVLAPNFVVYGDATYNGRAHLDADLVAVCIRGRARGEFLQRGVIV